MKKHTKSSWRIEMLIFENGERYPILLNEKGDPLFKPNVYTVSMLRNRGLAESTMERSLRAIVFLYTWGQKYKINIEERFRKGEFLELHEIEKLSADVNLLYRDLCDFLVEPLKRSPRRRHRAIPPKTAKAKKTHSSPSNVWSRFWYIYRYLDWLADMRISRASMTSHEYQRLSEAKNKMISEIKARMTRNTRLARDPEFERLGLSHKAEKALLLAVASQNPFKQSHAKTRNKVIVKMLLETGIRRGELLGIRISDVNMQENILTIHRTPNDCEDPRTNKPQTKTRARRLPITNELASITRDYIVRHRRGKRKKAGNHPFLFVESRVGNPLTKNGLTKVFNTLRASIPGLPARFSPHYCRYTWNDRFSENADKMISSGKWTLKDEIEARCQLMGWTENSPMAAIYARRHNKEKADEFCLKRQEDILKKDAE